MIFFFGGGGGFQWRPNGYTTGGSPILPLKPLSPFSIGGIRSQVPYLMTRNSTK